MFGENFFGIVDYIVLAFSLIFCLLIGAYYAYFSQHTNEELLVGGRNMRILPVAASIMVSFFSAITILGYPSEIYMYGIEIYGQAIFQAIGMIVAAYLLIPFFYPMKITSIYEYLELRYESKMMRRVGAVIFTLEQLSLAGMILYAPSIALKSFLGLPMWLSVFGVGMCGTLYTALGGLKAVVWTDAFQFLIMVIGLVGIMVKGFMEVGGVGEAFSIAYTNGRLKLFDFTVDPFMRHNVLNFVLGSGVMQIMRTAGHQLLVQRYMSLPNVENAKKSVILSVPLKMTVMSIMLLTGVALYAANAGCDPVLNKRITKHDQMLTLFVVEKLSNIPGSLGLFTAAIFSAVLSSLSSMLNSLAAVTWEDFLSGMRFFRKMGPRSQANVSRLLSLFYGVVAMFLAFLAKDMGAMYAASFAVVGVTSGIISGLLTMGAFMPFINKLGAIVGALAGLFIMTTVSALGFIYKASVKRELFIGVQGCAGGNYSTPVPVSFVEEDEVRVVDDDEISFPSNNSYSLSYIMYPFVGSTIAVLIGFVVSAATGGLTKSQINSADPKYIHQFARRMFLEKEAKEGKEMEIFLPKAAPSE